MKNNDTIAAQATAYGNAGVAIIRLSGKMSLPIIRRIFKSKDKLRDRYFCFGRLYDKKNKIIDEVLVCYFKSPHSYTAEDMAEIHCHGGFITSGKVLKRVLEEGARMANPGEFTERAFLSGRIDLTQAEAVADIIYAKSDKAQKIAEEQLQGSLKNEIQGILNEVFDVNAQVLANIDFPDEDIPEISKADIAKKIKKPILKIEKILESASSATLYKEGLKVAIVGLPNSGKSSLLNALVKDSRAIVTEIPGTTRDTLEEQIELGGFLVRLFDTAGITKTENKIEKEGILRSFEAIKKADLILLLAEKYSDKEKFLKLLKPEAQKTLKEKSIIFIKSKADLKKPKEILKKDGLNIIKILECSAKTGKGIKKIEEEIFNTLKKEESDDSVLITSLRHKNLLEKALHSLKKSLALAQKDETEDKILTELEEVLINLKEILGQDINFNVLEKIFSRFCVGK